MWHTHTTCTRRSASRCATWPATRPGRRHEAHASRSQTSCEPVYDQLQTCLRQVGNQVCDNKILPNNFILTWNHGLLEFGCKLVCDLLASWTAWWNLSLRRLRLSLLTASVVGVSVRCNWLRIFLRHKWTSSHIKWWSMNSKINMFHMSLKLFA